MNGESKSTNGREGSLPWLARWACRAFTRDFCSALAALFGPEQNIFFLAVHYFNSFVPIAQQAVQAAVLGHLSLSVSLCLRLPILLNLLFVQVRCTHPDERIPGGHLGCGARQQRGNLSSHCSGSGAFGSADPDLRIRNTEVRFWIRIHIFVQWLSRCQKIEFFLIFGSSSTIDNISISGRPKKMDPEYCLELFSKCVDAQILLKN